MAVSIQIGSTDSASNVINKQVSLRAAISATLKQPCSVETPTFILNSNLVSSADNYLYCSDFGRYYYITDIVPMTGGQQSVTCSVDPLMSYAEQIKNIRSKPRVLMITNDPRMGKVAIEIKVKE